MRNNGKNLHAVYFGARGAGSGGTKTALTPQAGVSNPQPAAVRTSGGL